MPAFGSPPRTRGKERPPIFRTGPRLYQLGKSPTHVGQGPGDPPPGFVGAHQSRDEWWFYWALSKIFHDPKDPRRPPFVGGQLWKYQIDQSPTGVGLGIGRVPGGAVADFAVRGPTGTFLIIRIVTERFHVFANATKQASDFFQRDHLRGVEKVIDVYSSDYLGDPTGNAVCRIAALAVKGVELLSPIKYRSALRVRTPH